MSKMLLVAIFAGATERTTPTVLAHRRRHLLSTGDIPSPRIAAPSLLPSRPDDGHRGRLHDGHRDERGRANLEQPAMAIGVCRA